MGFQINQGSSGRRNFRPQPMSEINVTPFVDVMLVLLVVFMITAPMLSQGVSVNLPQVESQAMTEEVEPLEVSVRKDGVIYLQSNEISQRELLERLTAIRASKPGTGVLLRAVCVLRAWCTRHSCPLKVASRLATFIIPEGKSGWCESVLCLLL